MSFFARSRLFWSLCLIALVAANPGPSAQKSAAGGSGDTGRIAAVLEPIRARHKLPVLAGAIVTSRGLLEIGATGVRRSGRDVRVTIEDQWHLGSDTEGMTATLIGLLVERGPSEVGLHDRGGVPRPRVGLVLTAEEGNDRTAPVALLRQPPATFRISSRSCASAASGADVRQSCGSR